MREEKRTLVFYEDQDSLVKLLEELGENLGRGRQCVIAQDISKRTERYYRGTVGNLSDDFQNESTPKILGQFVVIVEGGFDPLDMKDKEKNRKKEFKLAMGERELIKKTRQLRQQKQEVAEEKKKYLSSPYA